MKPFTSEGGVALAVTLFMLALLTIIGVSAVTLSNTHFRLVGNLQTANEAEMALRSALEQMACEIEDGVCKEMKYGRRNMNIPVNGHQIQVEINPKCNGAAYVSAEGTSQRSRNSLDTYWDLEAKVNDVFGTKTTVHWGLMVPLTGRCPQP